MYKIQNKIERLLEESKSLLLQESNAPKVDPDIIYHYAPAKYDSLKSLALQGKPNPKGEAPDSDYNRSFSALPSPLTKETINKYRNSGFKAWGNGPIYEYKISVSRNKPAWDGPIRFTSVPEQFKYSVSFEDAFKKAGIDRPRAIKDNKYWEEVKDKYYKVKRKFWDDRDKYLAGLGYEIPSVQWNRAPKADQMRKEFDKWVEYNLKHGSKDQYASYIPHIHTLIKKPIVYEEVKRII